MMRLSSPAVCGASVLYFGYYISPSERIGVKCLEVVISVQPMRMFVTVNAAIHK
jgi:hypothetical protein